MDDPTAFLAQFKGSVILDEIQRVPELLSYIQAAVDEKRTNGQFVLTGSHQLALRDTINQSLAGRTSTINLLPLSIAELAESKLDFESFGKRVIKSPKYYFIDTGLLVFLLGIEKPNQVTRDPLVGQLFENLVVIECLKCRTNQGKIPNLYFYRDSNNTVIYILPFI